MLRLPSESVFEALRYLTRNDIDTVGIVSRRLARTTIDPQARLPLRPVEMACLRHALADDAFTTVIGTATSTATEETHNSFACAINYLLVRLRHSVVYLLTVSLTMLPEHVALFALIGKSVTKTGPS